MICTLSILLLLSAGLGYARPQAASSCVTTTVEVIIPTSTYTFLSTDVVTTTPTTADDLGTFTEVTTISKTTTVETLTSTTSVCGLAVPIATESVVTTVYTSATPTERKRLVPKHGDLVPRQDSGCTVTTTLTTTYGVTETYIPANKTSTFKDYTAFTMKTVSKTSSGGHAYVIATATATTSVHCGALTVTNNATMSTTTQDSRCAPSAMVSQYSGFGLDYLEETPDSGGAIYVTDASDASSCCQICADAVDCASSAWDIRSNQCRLQFDVDQHSGELVCGQIGVIAVNEDGPLHPMAPGTGWYLAAMCGTLEEVNGLPDDGS